MPTIDSVTTKSASIIWQSPDKARTIYEVVFDYQGQAFKAKTYSSDISTEGWSGTVLAEERPNKRTGELETFVKQPPKEGGFQASGGSSPRSSFGGQKHVADPFTMFLSYAKDIAVGMMGTEGGFQEAKFGEILAAVSAGGHTLYEARPGGELDPSKDKVQGTDSATVKDLSDNIDNTLDMSEIKKVFGEEAPWNPS